MGVLLELESRPGRQRTARMIMADDAVTIDGNRFAWSEIDRLHFSAVNNFLNGSYLGTTFTIMVGTAARRKATFLLASGTTGALKHKIDHETRNAFSAQFNRAVDILDERVGRRLVAEAVAAVRGGQEVTFADLRLDREGIHKGGLFRRSIPWPEVAGTERRYPNLTILSRQGRGITVIEGRWNVVLVPRVVVLLTQP